MKPLRPHYLQFTLGVALVLTSQWHAAAQTNTAQNAADRAAPAALAAADQPERVPYVRQTESERFRYYLQHMFSPESVLRAGAAAGINQAMNSPWEWGQGGIGYGRRFASAYGEHIIQSTSMYGLGTVLHEDNRYFLSGETGFGPRLKYALLSTMMGRHDDGSRHFSFSQVASYGIAAGVSRVWQPPSTSGPGSFAGSFAVGIAAEAGFNVVREFFPSILHARPPVALSQAYAH